MFFYSHSDEVNDDNSDASNDINRVSIKMKVNSSVKNLIQLN